MEPLYWSPASPIFEMPPAEAAKLPWRVVWFGSTQHIPAEVLRFIRPECRNSPFLLMSNFDVPAELKRKLSEVCAYVRDGEPAHAWDADRMATLLRLQGECLECFEASAPPAELRVLPINKGQ